MPCSIEPLGAGSWAVICGAKRMPGRCVGCDESSTLLCDGPRPYGRDGRATCDAPICRACATAIGRNRDLCPGCATITRVEVVPDHPRAAEWRTTFGEPPGRVVWNGPRASKTAEPAALVWRLHLAQLEPERVLTLTKHVAAKYGHPSGYLHAAFVQGRLHPTVEAELLRVVES